MRILVAEDEKDLNRLLSTRLKAEHYSVDSCFDGQEALDYLEGAPYDAVVLDIMMPVLDGLSVLKTMRQKGSQTPVLLLTAKDSVEDRVRGLDAGANDYLVKPFAFEELRASGCFCANQRRRRRQSANWMIWKYIWIPIRCCVQGMRSSFPERSLRCCAI